MAKIEFIDLKWDEVGNGVVGNGDTEMIQR